MSVTGTPRSEAELRGWARLVAAVLGLGLLAPLVTACLLTPSPEGRGTHQQLGLPPCTIVVLFGRPCPTCGMTTSWAHVVRGQLGAALRANVGGTLLCLIAMVAAPWLLASALRGRWVLGRLDSNVGAWIGVAVALVTLLDWLWRLWHA